MTESTDALRAALGPVGIWTAGLDSLPVLDVVRAAARIERAGAGGLWFGEAYGRESFSTAQLLLEETSTLMVGSSIMSIWGRDAFAVRAAQATVNARRDGRFVVGLGVSHKPLVEGLRGHSYDRPMAAMRGYLEAFDQKQPFVVDAAPARPLMIAALGPRMLELAATHADGALPYLTMPAHTAEARARMGPDPVLVVEQAAVIADVAPDEAAARAAAHLEIYSGLPNYRGSWLRQGFGDEDLVRGGSARLQAALVVRGMEATQRRIKEHLDAGADQVAVQVLGASPLAFPEGDILSLLDGGFA